MYKIEKFKYESRNDHYWCSDFHNFHDPSWNVPIWKSRGYSSPEESYRDVQQKINTRVKNSDYLWVLGDSFLSATDDNVVDWWRGVNCQNIRYLFGNHASQMYRLYKQEMLKQYDRDDIEVYPLRMNNVVFVGNHHEIQIGKQRIIMNHFPLRTHNQVSHGSWGLHGHSHNNDKTRNPDYHIGKFLDLSWDWKKDIWSYEEIEDVMSTKEIFVSDHH